jgi:hypothetical protein
MRLLALSHTLINYWMDLLHNPIVELNDVVLDPTDGDFSVTINGKEHWWIEDSAIIKIADYIEKNSI